MRSNYLQLQKLYNELSVSTPPTSVQTSRYDDLLAESENHNEVDDRIARFFASGLSSRKPTWFEGISAIYWLGLRLLLTSLLYALPLAVGLYAWAIK